MKSSVAFTVLGGDARMRACASGLQNFGYTVYDLPHAKVEILAELLPNTEVLILPIPAFSDGKITGSDLSAEQLLSLVGPECLMFGGVVPRQYADRIIDYNQDEAFQLSGAIATAEATISILVEKMPITLYGSSALIIGNGRIGKALSKRLSDLGMEVTVSARKDTDWLDIAAQGLRADHTGIYRHGLQYHCIINTVPALVLPRNHLEQVDSSCLLVDLASKPGGLDWQACKELGLQTIHALALPGKTAPVTSGLAIRDTILNHLNLL